MTRFLSAFLHWNKYNCFHCELSIVATQAVKNDAQQKIIDSQSTSRLYRSPHLLIWNWRTGITGTPQLLRI